jgi:predicted porin
VGRILRENHSIFNSLKQQKLDYFLADDENQWIQQHKYMFETAGALVAFSSAANAGITIPAGDWTVDLGGNVNAFYSNTKVDGAAAKNGIGAGLLPSAIGIGAKTRQNDLDIAVQFTFFVGSSAAGANGASGAALNGNTINIRQAYMTFGDASWGTIKAGRDLGVFGSDAILSDMTLLGVGGNYAPGGSSTLGRIGQGYIYADWIGQIAYTTPNFNGFQVTGALLQPMQAATGANGEDLGYQAKATYDFAANDVTGRVWVGGTTQKNATYTSSGFDVGAKVGYQGAQLVGYYYMGDGLSSVAATGNNAYTNAVLLGGINGSLSGTSTKSDDSGGYVQATFTVPGIGTKLGASYGESNSKNTTTGKEASVETWIVGAYHPLTKSLNLVAEYANADNKYTGVADVTVKTTSLGAILFF